MTPDEEMAHEKFVECHDEEQRVRNNIAVFGGMTVLAVIPALVFGGVVAAFLNLPSWSVLLLAVPMVLVPKLYALWRFDQSSLPLKIAGIAQPLRERRQWLIIAAVIIIADLLLRLLVPLVIDSAGDW